MNPYGNKRDLLSRIKYSLQHDEQKPISLLVGSGLSLGAIPGTIQTINVCRTAIAEDERFEFDEELSQYASPGLKYQAAFNFVSRRLPPEERDKIIRAITLNAYSIREDNTHRLPEKELSRIEADITNWRLTPGSESIGRIWAGLPAQKRGPIVTTNFDPLLEISLQKSSAHFITDSIDADGVFRSKGVYNDVTQIFHIHGFWRESSTLSMTSQLTTPRPGLAGSLRELLKTHTVLVTGYSGWQDAFMLELQRIVGEMSYRDLDILWCHHGDDSSLEAEINTNTSLAALQRAPGNVQFYTEIDAHKVIPELERHIAEYLEYQEERRDTSTTATPPNWLKVTSSLTNTVTREQESYRALEFFNGRIPAIGDGFNNAIPRLDIVSTISNEVRAKARARTPSMTLLVGPSGEGKSMALIQVAAEIAQSKSNAVVYFSKDGAVESIVDFLKIEHDNPIIFVVDNAQKGAGLLRDVVRSINDDAVLDVHFVLGVRDTDWSSVGGSLYAWRNYIEFKRHRIHGISRLDAVSLIHSWERLGERALGSLSELPDTEARIEHLLNASRDPRVSGDGSLFGALLATRYGEGLTEHVRQLVIALGDRLVASGRGSGSDSLLHAFACLAIPHSLGFTGISRFLLARALGLSQGALESEVISPLCDEAAITADSDRLATRHLLIAQAVVDVLVELEFDIEGAIKALVTEAVRYLDSGGMSDDATDLAYMSRRLRDPSWAVFAAKCSVEASPHRMSYKTSLSKALRFNGQPAEAAKVCRDSLRIGTHSFDRDTGLRVAAVEWAVCEGIMRNYRRNALLAAWGLGTWKGSTSLKEEQVPVALNCLTVALSRLFGANPDLPGRQVLACVLFLAAAFDPDSFSEGNVLEARRLLGDSQSFVIDDADMAAHVLLDFLNELRNELVLEAGEPLQVPRFDFSDLVHLVNSREELRVEH